MEPEIAQWYRAARRAVPAGTPVTVLHIGTELTDVATVADAAPEKVLTLAIGSRRTAAEYFKHLPPTAGELEAAIMVVEDEVSRARTITSGHSMLLTTDVSIRDLALVAGIGGLDRLVLSVEAVERLFDQLAALSLGRPVSSAGIPIDPEFAATLLILREFMHHLKFVSITYVAEASY